MSNIETLSAQMRAARVQFHVAMDAAHAANQAYAKAARAYDEARRAWEWAVYQGRDYPDREMESEPKSVSGGAS